MRKSSKVTILIILLILIGILLILLSVSPKIKSYIERQKIEKENQKVMEEIAEIKPTTITETPQTLNEKVTRDIKIKRTPGKAYLKVPFICQAPLETGANWKFHEESCEEAALLQAYLYETGKTMTKEEANAEILKMIDWQEQNFGGHKDIYAEKLKEFAIKFYGIEESKIEIIFDATIEDIKYEIALGHPVIVPITGDILNNPYYPYPGYHMLVVIGYTEDKIITNDNGTRRGKDFSYETSIFESAMKDTGGDIVVVKLR